jgi:hypothetical protein
LGNRLLESHPTSWQVCLWCFPLGNHWLIGSCTSDTTAKKADEWCSTHWILDSPNFFQETPNSVFLVMEVSATLRLKPCIPNQYLPQSGCFATPLACRRGKTNSVTTNTLAGNAPSFPQSGFLGTPFFETWKPLPDCHSSTATL